VNIHYCSVLRLLPCFMSISSRIQLFDPPAEFYDTIVWLVGDADEDIAQIRIGIDAKQSLQQFDELSGNADRRQ